MEAIVKVIKASIQKNGRKIAFVADEANIERQRFYRIMNGGATLTATELIRVCNICGIDPNDFREVV